MTTTESLKAFPIEISAQHQRLARVMYWLIWMISSVLLIQIVGLYLFPSVVFPVTSIISLFCLATTIGARLLVLRGLPQLAGAIIIFTFLTSVLLINVLLEVPLLVLVLPIIFVAIVSLSLLQGRMFLASLVANALVGVVLTLTNTYINITLPGQSVREDGYVLVTVVWLLLGMIYVLLWMFHQRLRLALNELQDANSALLGAQQALAIENEWLTITLDTVSDAIMVIDASTRISLMNTAASQLFGYQQEKATGQFFERVVQWRDERNNPPVTDPVRAVLMRRQPLLIEANDNIEIIAADGKRRNITARISPIINRTRVTAGAVMILADVTAQKQAQQALNRSEELFTKVFQSSLIGIALLTLEDSYFVDANDQLLNLIGYNRSKIIGRPLADLGIVLYPAMAERLRVRLRRRRAIRNIEMPYRTSTGALREALTSFEVFDVGNEAYVILMAQDITERRMTELALRESVSLYRLITENTHDLIALLDETECYLYLSPSHQRVLGYHIAQMIGSSMFDLVHPDDQLSLRSRWHDLVQKDEQLASVRFRCADTTWHWFELQATAVEQGGARSILLVARDTTQRRNLEAQFHQAQKMESMGRLAGGVAHDFNNMLSAITGYTELVLDDLPSDSPLRSDINEIQRASTRATGLARQLLTLARKQVIEAQTVDLNDLILDIDKLLRRLLREDIELVTLLSSEPCMAKVDSGQIEQVLINLAVNARDALPRGGKLVIETQTVVLDDEYVLNHIGVARGTYALITVTDNGIGMDSEVKRQAFEPFFTTKPPGEGTGLGLATCYGIVKQHGGSINLYSERNQGTTFKVYLPTANTPVSPLLPPVDLLKPPPGTETILLAEDEASVRELTTRVLRTQGYTVIAATNGEEALRAAETYRDGPIHLLLTDLVMPQMSGTMLAERVRELLPNIRLIFMSGYPGSTISEHGQLIANTTFIQKPFSITMLATKVREVLDADA